MTLTNKGSRLKHWFFIALIFVSTLVGLIPTEAWATPSGAGMDYFTGKSNGYYAGIFLRDCLAQTKQTKAVTNTDGGLADGRPPLSDYDKTSTNPGVDIGRYYAPNNGWLKDSQGCASVTDVNIALGNFGYSKASDFFQAMGYTASGTISIRTGTLPPVDYSLYVASSTQTVQDKINSRIGITYHQWDEDKFFVYDTVFGASGCELNSPVTGSGTKATYVEVVEDPAGSGKFTTKSVDVEFPISTSTTPAPAGSTKSITKEAEKVITAYDYGGHYGSDGKTNDITCADLLTLRNKYAAAMAAFNNKNPDKAIVSDVSAAVTQNPGSDQAACVGGALGWLLCPIVTIMDNLNKSMANYIESMLRVDVMLPSSDSRTALQSIWSMLVGIANLLLVVAFLVVIFSQATSIGLSAYGIKKMLPRIIAAAILINLSFFVCGVLVDIFNIVGGSVKQIISIGIASIPDSKDTLNLGAEISSWIIGLSGMLVVLTAAALLGLIAFVLPVIATGTLATLGFFVAIAFRQVLIVLLIVISPIAIAAMILPNTEPLFKKWMSGFIKLLALYPIVIGIMYGCTLVAKIILAGT